MEDGKPREIDLVPINELNITIRLKRELRSAGAKDLRAAFLLDDYAIARNLGKQSEDELERYRDLMEIDPLRLSAKLLTPKRSTTTPAQQQPARTMTKNATPTRRLARSTSTYRPTSTQPFFSKVFQRLPQQPFAKTLQASETAASVAFRSILTHASSAIIAETFPYLDVELADYRDAWIEFFHFYRNRHTLSTAFTFIPTLLPHSYLVFVADAARRHFDRSTLWGHIYDELGFDGNQGAQTQFKKTFFDTLKRFNLQIYDQSETTLRFKYTALLHAGLSEEAWRALWEDTLIPLAKGTNYRYAHEGIDILHYAIERDGSLAVKNLGVRRMLERAPKAALASMLEAGYRTAKQWSAYESGFHSSEAALVSSEGMSAEAMRALLRVVEGEQAPAKTHGSSGKTQHRFYWIKDPTLLIDLRRHNNPVCIKIEAQRLSEAFSGREFEVYLNGDLANTVPVRKDHRGCLLPRSEVWVGLSEQYMVNIKIVDKQSGVRREIASRTTNFLDKREGIFEFCGTTDSVQLKFQTARHNNASDVRRAYIVYPGYNVMPGHGMTPVPVVQGESEFSVVAFDVSEGGSASVVDSDGTQVLWLQERFASRIDKTWLIGKAGRKDLFGHPNTESDYSYNSHMPLVEVDAPGISDARTVLEVTCVCDGKRIYPLVKLAGLHAAPDSGEVAVGSRLLVDLSLTLVPPFVNDGRLIITYKLTNETVLDYRFSVVPINGLRLTTIQRIGGELVAGYAFAGTSNLLVRESVEGDPQSVACGQGFLFERPLNAQLGRLFVAPYSEPEAWMGIDLMLAGMDVGIPNGMEQGNRALRLPELSESQQEVSLSVRADRTWGAVRRGFYLSVDTTPVAYDDAINTAMKLTYSLSEAVASMRPYTMIGGKPTVSMLKLAVSYGWQECVGENIKSGEVLLGYIYHAVVDDVAPGCDDEGPYVQITCQPGIEWCARFNYHTTTNQFDDVDENEVMQGRIHLPNKAIRLARAGREVDLEIASWSFLQLQPSWDIVQVVRIPQP